MRMLLIAAIITVLFALGSFALMMLWNDVLVDAVTFAKPIDWGQSFCILVLSRLLFTNTGVSS